MDLPEVVAFALNCVDAACMLCCCLTAQRPRDDIADVAAIERHSLNPWF